jgi:hypothetical protein
LSRISSLISGQVKSDGTSAWDAFVEDEKLRKIDNITDQGMAALSISRVSRQLGHHHDAKIQNSRSQQRKRDRRVRLRSSTAI